jgi:uncharacterized membrane protein
MEIIFKIFISSILILLFDYIYLNSISSHMRSLIFNIQSSPLATKLPGVVLCYLLIIIGINYFVIIPEKSIFDAFLLGFIIYGIFETTTYAIFRKWGALFPGLIDTIWGGILFAAVTFFTYRLTNVQDIWNKAK